MKFYSYLNEANPVDFVFHKTSTMREDYDEYKKKEQRKWKSRAEHMGFRFPIFPTFESYMKSLLEAKSVDNYNPTKINNISNVQTIDQLKSLVSQYQRPRDVDRIVDGLKAGDKIPMPVVLKGDKGMWIMSGNTRFNAYRILFKRNPTILIIDVSKSLRKDNFKIIETIERECSQYLQELGDEEILYRGFLSSKKFIEKTPRKDRVPRDTPTIWHKAIDEAFKKKFGWKVRSSGIFAAKHYFNVAEFGVPFLFFPVNGYKYVWNPDIRDLTVEMDNRGLTEEEENGRIVLIYPDSRKGQDFIQNLINGYKTNGMKDSNGNEVIFNCKKYYLLNSQKINWLHRWDWEKVKRALLEPK